MPSLNDNRDHRHLASSARLPAVRIPVTGGTASAVIDLSGGPDEPPEPKMVSLPQWPGLLAHTRADDEHIYLTSGPVYHPDDPVDMRCGSCTARSEIGIDNRDRMLVFIVHHQPGCQAVEDLLAVAGVS